MLRFPSSPGRSKKEENSGETGRWGLCVRGQSPYVCASFASPDCSLAYLRSVLSFLDEHTAQEERLEFLSELRGDVQENGKRSFCVRGGKDRAKGEQVQSRVSDFRIRSPQQPDHVISCGIRPSFFRTSVCTSSYSASELELLFTAVGMENGPFISLSPAQHRRSFRQYGPR